MYALICNKILPLQEETLFIPSAEKKMKSALECITSQHRDVCVVYKILKCMCAASCAFSLPYWTLAC